MTAIVATSPVVAIVLPPTQQVTLVVTVPEPLATDLHQAWTAEDERHAAHSFKRFSFDEWLIERFKDLVYGRGIDAGELADAAEG